MITTDQEDKILELERRLKRQVVPALRLVANSPLPLDVEDQESLIKGQQAIAGNAADQLDGIAKEFIELFRAS